MGVGPCTAQPRHGQSSLLVHVHKLVSSRTRLRSSIAQRTEQSSSSTWLAGPTVGGTAQIEEDPSGSVANRKGRSWSMLVSVSFAAPASAADTR